MINRILGTVVLAVLVSSCALEGAPETTASTEQGLIWACDGTNDWTRYWRVNGVEVGREDCDCSGFITSHGTITGVYSQVLEHICTTGGGGGGGGGGGCRVAAPTQGSTNNVPPSCP